MQLQSRSCCGRILWTIFTAITLLGYSIHSLGWGRDGHTAIGVLAIDQVQHEALVELQNFINPLTKQAMDEACNWPDMIRDTEEGEWSGRLHYVNIPHGEDVYSASRDCPAHTGASKRPAQHCATEAIKFYSAGLANPRASKEQRWQAFAWLCHLVADLHQPLHAGFSDDRGGNDVEVSFKNEQMNLHQFWDSKLIIQRAGSWQYLVGELSVFPHFQADSNWSPEMVNDWTTQSHKLAREYVYPAPGYIDETYAQQSWELIQRQIRLAAYRLALIINSELKPARDPAQP